MKKSLKIPFTCTITSAQVNKALKEADMKVFIILKGN